MNETSLLSDARNSWTTTKNTIAKSKKCTCN